MNRRTLFKMAAGLAAAVGLRPKAEAGPEDPPPKGVLKPAGESCKPLEWKYGITLRPGFDWTARECDKRFAGLLGLGLAPELLSRPFREGSYGPLIQWVTVAVSRPIERLRPYFRLVLTCDLPNFLGMDLSHGARRPGVWAYEGISHSTVRSIEGRKDAREGELVQFLRLRAQHQLLGEVASDVTQRLAFLKQPGWRVGTCDETGEQLDEWEVLGAMYYLERVSLMEQAREYGEHGYSSKQLQRDGEFRKSIDDGIWEHWKATE